MVREERVAAMEFYRNHKKLRMGVEYWFNQ
jgi:hypothetical protein